MTLFEGSALFGGLIATVDEVDGMLVPGKFSGQDLAIHLLEDARKVGVRVVQAGIEKFEMMPAVGDSPRFIEALASLARAAVEAKTAAPVENFTIDFDQSGSACTLHMKWETTDASVKIAAK